MHFFEIIFLNPVSNLLLFIYNHLAFHDFGIAIILLTLAIRAALFPVFYKSFKNQTVLQRLQPAIKKIQHDHKDNKEKQAQALLELYKQNQVNPFVGIALFAVQLPVLITIYQVLLKSISSQLFSNPLFLGLINLQKSNIVMVGLACVAQYFQGRMSVSGSAAENKTARIMALAMPAFTLIILMKLPSAIALYWLATTLFSIGQQIIINRRLKTKDNGGNVSKNTQIS